MKKILLILAFLCLPFYVYWNEDIDIETSSRLVEFWDTFDVTITLTDLNIQQSGGQLSLPGIENFDVFSQSMESQVQSVNSETQSVTKLVISLQARNVWEYTLWPVKITGNIEEEDNEKLNITITSNGQNQNITPPAWVDQESSTTQDELSQKLSQQEDLESNWWLREVKLSPWTHLAFVVFFFVSFYLLLRYVFQKETPKVTQVSQAASEDTLKMQYKKYFETLSGEIGNIPSEDFFHQFNVWLRKIFWDMWVKNHRNIW